MTWTEQRRRRERILDLWAAGEKQEQIARLLELAPVELNRNAIYHVIHRARQRGDPRAAPHARVRNPKPTPMQKLPKPLNERHERILNLWADGALSQRDIAELVGYGDNEIGRAMVSMVIQDARKRSDPRAVLLKHAAGQPTTIERRNDIERRKHDALTRVNPVLIVLFEEAHRAYENYESPFGDPPAGRSALDRRKRGGVNDVHRGT